MDPESEFTSVRVGARSPYCLDRVVAWLGGFMALGTPEPAPAFRGGIGGSELDELVSLVLRGIPRLYFQNWLCYAMSEGRSSPAGFSEAVIEITQGGGRTIA